VFEAGSRHKLITLPARDNQSFASFSQDNRLVCVMGRDGKSLILWDTVEKKELPPIKNDVELEWYLISPDGKVIVTFDKTGGKVKSWEMASQLQISQFVRNKKPENEDTVESEPHVLSPDGQVLAFSDSTKVALWQVNSGAPLALGNQDVGGRVSVIAFSPDGKLLVAGYESGTVRIWDAVKRLELAAFMGHKDSVTALAFTPDGRTLASGGGAQDATVKLYTMLAMREILTLTHEPSPTSETHAEQGSEDTVSQLFFSRDGKAIISLSGNGILRTWRGNTPSQ